MKRIETHKISKYINGTFAEFFGTTTYDGIWVGKDSEIPNINGFRKDVVEGCREAGLTVFRWPGGCCAEKYHWYDGVGENRLPRMHFINDTNGGVWDMSFGTDECVEFCRLCGMEPMFVINVSSGTSEDARSWFEYCNAPSCTKYGAMRAKNGHEEPYNVKIWGIGNTDENTWCVSYDHNIYARDYLRYAEALGSGWLKDVTVIGLGLSIRHKHMEWAEKSLDIITENGKFKGADLLSVHHYLGSMKDKKCGDAVEYSDDEYYYLLDSLSKYQEDIDAHRRLVKDHTCSKYPTYIAMDEWGIWHAEATEESGQRQRQTMRDAIFAALSMHIFYRNSDFVKMAMQTQLINLLHSLFESDGKNFMRTPTFWVMKLYKEHLEQYLLENAINIKEGIVDAVASVSENGERIVLSAVNKDLYNDATFVLSDELKSMRMTMSDIITCDDVRAYNTYEAPDRICAKTFPINMKENDIKIPPVSIVRLVFEK